MLAAYPVALLLFVTPLLDLAGKVLPAHPGSVDWRFGAAGLFLNSVATLLLAMAIAMGAAYLARQRGMVRVLAWLSLLMGLALIAAVAALLAGHGAMRAATAPALKGAFGLATGKAVVMFVLALLVAGWFGFGGLRSLRGLESEGLSEGNAGGLVVGH